MKDRRTLVLNGDYAPMSLFPHPYTIPAEDAFTRVLNGTCTVVEEYDDYIQTQNPEFRKKWPSIIARKKVKHLAKSAPLDSSYLYYRDHCKCAYCGVQLYLTTITKDHVFPQSKGGTDTWDNVVAACPTCNHAKSDSLPKGQWRPKWDPWTPSYWQLLEIRRKFPVIIQHASWIPYLGKWEGEIKVA